MSQRYPGLRTVLTAAMLVVVLLAVAVSITLVVLTNRLHVASRELADAVESVQLASQAEIDLLLHGRSQDAVVRRDIEGDLRETIAALGPFVTSASEAQALRDVSERVEHYFAAAHQQESGPQREATGLDAADEALDALVHVNVAHARAARERVARWDSVANGVGLGTALGVLVVATGFLWWLRARGFRPVFGLLRSMERFGHGDQSARAEETGPSELYELAKRFNELASALSAQREVQTSFIGGVVHDLRNPVAALKLALVSARREDRAPPAERLERLTERADRQAARMERMLGDLLDSVRIQAGKLELQLDWRDGRDLIQEAALSLEETSPRHQLVIDLPEDPVWLHCDPLRIEQVLNNLVSNAIKFSPDGGRVAIELAHEADEAILSVADCGIGISDEDQRSLFEPFHRVGASKNRIPGVGLGLFVVREIVRAHGGRVEVTSVVGHGTTFRVHLPANMHPLPGAEAAPRRAAPEGSRAPH
jgi:two-component system, OmpR family, sensor histidine kinase MtrB